MHLKGRWEYSGRILLPSFLSQGVYFLLDCGEPRHKTEPVFEHYTVAVCTDTVVARSITSYSNDRAKILSQLSRCMGIVWVKMSILGVTCMCTGVAAL